MPDSLKTAPYRLGLPHLAAYAVSQYARANRGPLRGWLSMLVPAVFAIGVALAAMPRSDITEAALPRFLTALLVACLIFLGWFALIFASLIIRSLISWGRFANDPRFTLPRVVSLSADGIEMVGAEDRKDFAWQQVTDIYRSLGCIFMPLDNGQCHIIPETALSGAGVAASFYSKAVELRKQSPIVSVF